jgi:CheY-like chemotaxis protein
VVLLVEDEVLIRAAAAETLRMRGFQVVEARDAHEALRVLERIHIDIVFSDVTMPGCMDGIGLAKWVREYKPALKVILTSGKVYLTSDVTGGRPVIEKPYRLDDVADQLWAELYSN